MTRCKDCYFYEELIENPDYIVRKNHYCSSFIAAEKKKEGKE